MTTILPIKGSLPFHIEAVLLTIIVKPIDQQQ